MAVISDSRTHAPGHATPMDTDPILICYDGSRNAERAVEVAARLLGGRRAVVLDVGPLQEIAIEYPPSGSEIAALDRISLDDAAARARAGAKLAQDSGLKASSRAQLEAPTWRGVDEVAEEIGAAVIVLGSRGLSGIREFVDGSLSHQLATHAGRPLLVVPPQQPKPS